MEQRDQVLPIIMAGGAGSRLWPVSRDSMPKQFIQLLDGGLSAFQATETANPFEALFRNDAASNQAGVNPRFASAFAAVEEAALVSALSGASNQGQAQELALVNQGGPLDLTRFLRLKAEEEQKDLLPPA